MIQIIDTLSRIALENAAIIGPAVGLVLLLAARRWLGGWPDLWRARRAVLPVADRLADGRYDDELDAIDDRVGVDLETVAKSLPEKTGLPLQEREFVGTLDAPPATVRGELRSMNRVWPAWLASIQFDDDVGGERVWEVGSYAFRSEGFLGVWQFHVRLTPAEGGQRTRLWAHYERNPWRQPVRHYRSVGWDADQGVREVASWFCSDERFEPSERAGGG